MTRRHPAVGVERVWLWWWWWARGRAVFQWNVAVGGAADDKAVVDADVLDGDDVGHQQL